MLLCLTAFLITLASCAGTPEKPEEIAEEEVPEAAEAEGPRELKGIEVVESSGVAIITGGDTAGARDAAIADALRKAVEQAVGTLVSAETMVENYAVLSDNVYTESQGYVKAYEVLEETPGLDLYRVRVRAEVAVGSIRDDLSALGLVIRGAERPRILFMIAERSVGKTYYSFWWWGKSEYRGEVMEDSTAENALREIFINKGFPVVDISASTGRFEIKDRYRIADLTRDATISIGRGLDAEVVVYGKARVSEGPSTPGSNVEVYLSEISAQAVRVDDGLVLASSSASGTARHISPDTGPRRAVQDASEKLAGRLIDQIAAKWSGPATVTITLTGVADQAPVAEFKRLLKSRVRGVGEIYQRRLENGTAVLEVYSRSSAQEIADALTRVRRGEFTVTGTTANTVEVSYGSR